MILMGCVSGPLLPALRRWFRSTTAMGGGSVASSIHSVITGRWGDRRDEEHVQNCRCAGAVGARGYRDEHCNACRGDGGGGEAGRVGAVVSGTVADRL